MDTDDIMRKGHHDLGPKMGAKCSKINEGGLEGSSGLWQALNVTLRMFLDQTNITFESNTVAKNELISNL